jgi:hypothetical protein
MEKFNCKKSNDAAGKEQYRIEVSDRFAGLEYLEPRWILIVND